MLRAGLKAGIIMGIVAAVVDVILWYVLGLSGSLDLESLACFLPLLTFVLWFATGILAARFGATAALTTGAAAGAGALAGAITQIIGRIADVVMNLITLALGLVSVPFSPGTIQWLAYAGIRPDEIVYFTYHPSEMPEQLAPDPVGSFILCVGVSVAIAAGLGAVGGILGKVTSARKGS